MSGYKEKAIPVGQLLEFDPPFPKLELTNCVCLEYLRTCSSFLGKFSLNVFFTRESSSGGMESGGNKAWAGCWGPGPLPDHVGKPRAPAPRGLWSSRRCHRL